MFLLLFLIFFFGYCYHFEASNNNLSREKVIDNYLRTGMSQPEMDPPSSLPESSEALDGVDTSESKASTFNRDDIVKALEVVERDSVAIAESFSSLFASLRLTLSEVSFSFPIQIFVLNFWIEEKNLEILYWLEQKLGI